MSRYTEQDKVIALAGLFQAVTLVNGLAKRGELPEEGLAVAIRSVLDESPPDVVSIYDDISCLKTGLTSLVACMGSARSVEDAELLGYALSCMHLERKLSRKRQLIQGIRAGLDRASEQVDQFSLVHENVIANLANIYVTHVSTLKPRIMVKGEQAYLSNRRNINRIRALLLAAIRAAVLWQQCGGGRMDLFVRRKAIAATAAELLGG